jgi:hypothetical protein
MTSADTLTRSGNWRSVHFQDSAGSRLHPQPQPRQPHCRCNHGVAPAIARCISHGERSPWEIHRSPSGSGEDRRCALPSHSSTRAKPDSAPGQEPVHTGASAQILPKWSPPGRKGPTPSPGQRASPRAQIPRKPRQIRVCEDVCPRREWHENRSKITVAGAGLAWPGLACGRQKMPTPGAEKCSKKVQKTVDRFRPFCNSERTHGKHITTK